MNGKNGLARSASPNSLPEALRARAQTRRAFLRTAGRGGALGLLALLAGGLASAGRARRLNGQDCRRDGVCAGCGRVEDCGLPAALSARARREEQA